MKSQIMKRTVFTLIVLLSTVLTIVAADTVEYRIVTERDTTVVTRAGGIALDSRKVRHYVYEYTSKDADGKPAIISGVIMIPSDVVDGSTPCDGIMLYNRATLSSPADAPSTGRTELLNGLIANPLRPNYILVMSDFIGYGSSSGYPMFYHSGDVNARNSLDGLLAARQLLQDKHIPMGKYLFNLGFSQGGSESLYVAKLRDMEYKDKGVTFDKTFAGGGPTDYVIAYKEYVKKDYCDDRKDVILMMVSAVENLHLNINYSDIFKEPLASHCKELVERKEKAVFNEIGIDMEGKLSDIIQPAYMNLESDEAKFFMSALENINLMNGWKPDLTQKYFIEHSRHDNYVPIQCVRAVIPWMTEKGFKPSLVPGKTNLQTNTLVIKADHTISSIVWLIQTMAAIQFWPVLYYEGEQNRFYHNAVKDLDIMKVLTTLEKWGIDVRKLLKTNTVARNRSQWVGVILSMIPSVKNALEKVDLTPEDLSEMLDDAGITDDDVIRVAAYLLNINIQTSSNRAPSIASVYEDASAPLYLLRMYEQILADWFKRGGFDVEYDSWK